MSSKQLYVIFRGAHTDWYVPVKDFNEGMGLKLFIKNWALGYGVDVTTELVTKSNRNIEKFPKMHFNNMMLQLKNILR